MKEKEEIPLYKKNNYNNQIFESEEDIIDNSDDNIKEKYISDGENNMVLEDNEIDQIEKEDTKQMQEENEYRIEENNNENNHNIAPITNGHVETVKVISNSNNQNNNTQEQTIFGESSSSSSSDSSETSDSSSSSEN